MFVCVTGLHLLSFTGNAATGVKQVDKFKIPAVKNRGMACKLAFHKLL